MSYRQLLARQAWRLVHFPDSLCARLLKSKYFPRRNLVDTAFCSNASATWQAIMHGLDLLKQGIIWRVGNGSQIRIWRDPWLPREMSMRVTTRQGRCRLRWVSELLHSDGRDWDYDKIVHIFSPADVEEISKLKIPIRAPEDFIAWHMEQSGIFTVRSAYNLALKIKQGHNTQSSSSSPNGERKLWSRVWSGHVPPKVSVFIWKLARHSLPTTRTKFVRRLEASDICPLCDREIETSYHATVACPRVQGLRLAMREHWRLPGEDQFRYTGG